VKRALQELLGLFVDDGALAAAILVWLALVALLLPHLGLPPAGRAGALFAGLALSLLLTCLRRARRT